MHINLSKSKIKSLRRERIHKKLKKGILKLKSDIRHKNPDVTFKGIPYYHFKQITRLEKKPEFSENIKFLINTKDAISKDKLNFKTNVFEVPEIFSIIENYTRTLNFLRKLFNALYFQTFETIYIDYKNCKQIDVCASMLMDIVLSDFINYYNESTKKHHRVKIDIIKPINYENYDVKKILFSIGAFKNIKGFKIDFDTIHPFPILIGDKNKGSLAENRELDLTKTVDYIIECLNKVNRTLTAKAETRLYKVLGEIIQNAEEHSTTSKRYSIGYFENIESSEGKDYGIFNFSILNFGNTIYETFSSPDCKNTKVVNQMKELSKKFTEKLFFMPSKFEEETLWTLYSLQDGVTRMQDWQRGNGSIRFIESFFKLKGNMDYDNISKMVINSGRTSVLFDGKYSIIEKERGKDRNIFKMITFNESGDIEDKPDTKYVKMEKNYFPGTLISAKIKIDYNNTEKL